PRPVSGACAATPRCHDAATQVTRALGSIRRSCRNGCQAYARKSLFASRPVDKTFADRPTIRSSGAQRKRSVSAHPLERNARRRNHGWAGVLEIEAEEYLLIPPQASRFCNHSNESGTR